MRKPTPGPTPETGMTLVEVLMTVAILAVVVAITVLAAVPRLAREAMHGALYDIQTHLQTTRAVAAARNRPCRFVVDTGAGVLRVLDGMGTAALTDDEVLHESRLPSAVAFARPDATPAVTLNALGGGVYDATIESDGTVSSGTGGVALFGGERFNLITLFAAGGMRIERWNGFAWMDGS